MTEWQIPPDGGHMDRATGIYYQTMTGKQIEDRPSPSTYCLEHRLDGCFASVQAEITEYSIAAAGSLGSFTIGDPAVLVADSQRARQELGWQPEYDDLESIIATAWNWETSFLCKHIH